MPVSFRFGLFGEEPIVRTLERFSDAVGDMRPAWEVLRRRFLDMEERQFASEGAYGSGGWDPLSPKYAAWKAVHYPGQTILRRTDDLYLSLTEGPEISILEPQFMVLGSGVDYGEFHQRGDGVPRRPPVDMPESERQAWIRVIQAHIVGADPEAVF